MSKTKTNISVKDNTGARVEASVIVGNASGYVSGDILDANATSDLISGAVDDIADQFDTIIGQLDDSIDAVSGRVTTIEDVLNLDQEEVTTAIDTFQEIVNFLANIDNDETLEGFLASIASQISACITSPSGTIATENIVNEADLDVSTLSNNSITFVV